MHIVDIIQKKAHAQQLSVEEMQFFMDELCQGKLPDYQTAALLMAIYINGMTDEELAEWTRIMAHSGDMVDLSAISGIKVDKHSTGGIGDKTTVIIGPIVAACGGKVAKMSGRGLGFSGGTIDKLESIPGFQTSLSEEKFLNLVNETGISVIGQTATVAVADKKLYALRDVTATVSSIPLIASSIMSKKLASGADKIVLDVKVGTGAFMKTLEEGRKLAKTMVRIGEANGRETVAILTNMNRPLGRCVGNLLEMQEAYQTLCGKGPEDLTELCLWLSAKMLELAGKGTFDECVRMAKETLENGAAAEKFLTFLAAQGGNTDVLEHSEKFYADPYMRNLTAKKDGYVQFVSSEAIGKASVTLGAGRWKKDDLIDHTAGIRFMVGPGDAVKKGDILCTLYSQTEEKLDEAAAVLKTAAEIVPDPMPEEPLIWDVIDASSLK